MKAFFIIFGLISFAYVGAQPQDYLDVKHLQAHVHVNDSLETVKGQIKLQLEVNRAVDSLFLNAKNYNSASVKSYNSKLTKQHLIIYHNFKPNRGYEIQLTYATSPKQCLYFTGQLNHPEFPMQIWTQGQGKYTSHWLPSLDDMTDKIEFDLTYTLPKQYQVVANGQLKSVTTSNQLKTWVFDMQQPMSSYLVAFAAGDFVSKTLSSNSQVTITNYLSQKDSLKFLATYKHSKASFDFLEQRIGVSFPWQNYKQVPVQDFLYAGMENTSCTIFSDEFVTDQTATQNSDFVNVEAHELAHQWFGNLVTETSARHHWLHEGFATYFSYLAQEHLFGTAYFEHRLFETAEQLTLQSNQGRGQAILNPKASSLTFYEKGAWALHALRHRVGDAVFFEAIKNYLLNFAYSSVETDDFLAEVQALTDINLGTFKKDWLLQTSFPAEEAQLILKQSEFIKQLFELKALRSTALDQKKQALTEALLSKHIDYFGPEVALQLCQTKTIDHEMLQLILETKHAKTRQVLIKNWNQPLPASLQSSFETLLKDASYITQEHAFLKLWLHYPNQRQLYIDQMSQQDGNKHLNIKLLRLMLTSLTYPEQAQKAVETLIDYTNLAAPYQIKRQAFVYLFQLNAISNEFIINLSKDLTHPVWRYRNFTKQLFDELIKTPAYKAKIELLLSDAKLDNAKKLSQILQ